MPNSPILESIAGNFTYGANFAVAGATARNNSEWTRNTGFNTPFSLNIQVSWLLRYKARMQFAAERNCAYSSCLRFNFMRYSNHLLFSADVILIKLYVILVATQPLPTVESLNSSLYVVNAGFQDYITILSNRTMTPSEAHDRALEMVPSVVHAIIEAVQVRLLLTCSPFIVLNFPWSLKGQKVSHCIT